MCIIYICFCYYADHRIGTEKLLFTVRDFAIKYALALYRCNYFNSLARSHGALFLLSISVKHDLLLLLNNTQKCDVISTKMFEHLGGKKILT